MSEQSTGTKAFEEKVSAQLQDAKSQIESIEARAKGTMAQAQVDAVNRLKIARKEIDKRRQELKTSGEANAAQIKAGIEADIAKLGAELEHFGAKLQGQAAQSRHHNGSTGRGKSRH